MLRDHKGNKKTSNKIPIVNYYHEKKEIIFMKINISFHEENYFFT